VYIRPLLRGEHGRLGLGHFAASATNLVLISGGPGLYDHRDVEHDMSWANYVTAPLLLAKQGTFSGRSDVLWLIYRPAYMDRWDDDVKARRTEVRRVRKLGFDSYVAMLNRRAHTRNWHLIWFESAGDLWTRLARLRDPISRVWYWGHAAKSGLWLTLGHTRSARPQRPAPGAVVTVKSISDHESLRFRFPRRQPHRFVGCNTANFAREWARVFRVPTEGVEGKVDFRAIEQTGGEPSLVRSAKWRRFDGTRARKPVPIRPLKPVGAR
jgi:hypothetical protein